MLGNHHDFRHRNNPASQTKRKLKQEMSVTPFIHSILSWYVPLTRAEGDDYGGADCSTECTGRNERFAYAPLISMVVHVANSYTMGTSGLPDISFLIQLLYDCH